MSWSLNKAAGGVLTAKQAPDRPGTPDASGLGLRTERAAVILAQTTYAKETTMRLKNFLEFLTSTSTRRPPSRRRPLSSWTRFETLEDRSLPSGYVVTDLGAFLPNQINSAIGVQL